MFPLGRTGIDTGSAVRRTDSDGSVDPGTVDDRARRAAFARDWSWLFVNCEEEGDGPRCKQRTIVGLLPAATRQLLCGNCLTV